jgi:tRNA pseudouridine55 synthase
MGQKQSILRVWKEEGETPLQMLERLREERKIGKDEKATYAGRLDPMAEGEVIVLTGEDCKKKEKYLGLDKEYEVEILFGFATDTHDILGKVTKKEGGRKKVNLLTFPSHTSQIHLFSAVQNTLKDFVGKFEQEYPKYSSKYLSQNADPEEGHSKEVEIYSIDILGESKINSESLLQNIQKRIAKVKGDFRQEEILNIWKENLEGKHEIFTIAKISCKCSSGTYMRSLAHNLGAKLGTPALAFSIKRIKIFER